MWPGAGSQYIFFFQGSGEGPPPPAPPAAEEKLAPRRPIRLKDVFISRPCNQQQAEHNWAKLNDLLSLLDKFFKLESDPNTNEVHLCLHNLDCLEARRISFNGATDLDKNPWEMVRDGESENVTRYADLSLDDFEATVRAYSKTTNLDGDLFDERQFFFLDSPPASDEWLLYDEELFIHADPGRCHDDEYYDDEIDLSMFFDATPP